MNLSISNSARSKFHCFKQSRVGFVKIFFFFLWVLIRLINYNCMMRLFTSERVMIHKHVLILNISYTFFCFFIFLFLSRHKFYYTYIFLLLLSLFLNVGQINRSSSNIFHKRINLPVSSKKIILVPLISPPVKLSVWMRH